MIKTSVILIHSLPDRKIKSLGNKALISFGKNNLLDCQIQFIRSTFKNAEIIVVGGFEHKKLHKYLNKKYNNIRYVYHEITEYINIGLSIQKALKLAIGKNIVIINGNLFVDKKASSDIKAIKNKNYIISTKQNKSPIGCIKNNNIVQNCFFDLPCSIYDFIYITAESSEQFYKCIYNTIDLEKFYIFEIINSCINKNIIFTLCDIDSRNIDIIDNISTIQKITRKQKKYA